ncbi:MAG: tryptophan-rich sensory protein [Planctomycetaceae bacterium]|jgi:translocator protein|nr:tryptophan-rich sensory protein [Planctomycetaceae bacterium]
MQSDSNLKPATGLFISFLVCFSAAAIGSLTTTPQIPNWYADLAKPIWTPPNWLFGPVWTILFSLMAIAAWLVWRKHGMKNARSAFGWFGIQLVLNSLWSVLFFGWNNPGAAAAEILLLWLTILLTMVTFSKKSKAAGLLLVPYFLWVSFAMVLNISIWQMNG